MSEGRAADERPSRCGKEHQPTVDEKPQFHLLPYGTAAQQATARSGFSGPFASWKDARNQAELFGVLNATHIFPSRCQRSCYAG